MSEDTSHPIRRSVWFSPQEALDYFKAHGPGWEDLPVSEADRSAAHELLEFSSSTSAIYGRPYLNLLHSLGAVVRLGDLAHYVATIPEPNQSDIFEHQGSDWQQKAVEATDLTEAEKHLLAVYDDRDHEEFRKYYAYMQEAKTLGELAKAVAAVPMTYAEFEDFMRTYLPKSWPPKDEA